MSVMGQRRCLCFFLLLSAAKECTSFITRTAPRAVMINPHDPYRGGPAFGVLEKQQTRSSSLTNMPHFSSNNEFPEKEQPSEAPLEAEENSEEETQVAATNTVNQRLMEELEQVKQQEKFGARSSVGKKLGLGGSGKGLTEEQLALLEKEQEERLAQVRDLNGVNPWVAIGGSLFALGMAAVLWTFTNDLGEWFATHPMEQDTSYVVLRLSGVFRNVAMGLVSLASGFFGVTGVGILCLGIRVLYGVVTGELDPTPIVKPVKTKDKELDLPSVWDLMTGKKKKRDDNKIDPFGM